MKLFLKLTMAASALAGGAVVRAAADELLPPVGESRIVVTSDADAAPLAAAVDADGSEFCPTLAAEFARRQKELLGADEPFAYRRGETAKHVPFLTLSEDGMTAAVVVGDGDKDGGTWHPMLPSNETDEVHFITHILAKDQDDKVVALKAMDPTIMPPATMTFWVPASATSLTPFEWCNLHGLWRGETVTVPAMASASKERRTKDMACMASNFEGEGAWTSVHADYLRLQKLPPHNSDAPFTKEKDVKHTPYITLKDDGKTASVLVGDPSVAVHPMDGSPDGAGTPHWIREIYVLDQTGTILTMRSLDSAGVDRAEIEFEVPEGTETLVAYSYCNLHGLWEGPAAKVENAPAREDDSASNSAGARAVAIGAAVIVSLLAAIGM
eukprot:CAMPEP_0172536930 /NCGR_PEP_ID=MMETSP1067-20121228/8637_1 /TAXON_ID=265564 ORGANISM="Thalassiosira punctigera, Strain Tpunct2005C2" /NCGR_SAMPLE_ID=MMETSP1067 /ASSEMBLY_ACC=CAM_ASM_000444 /LENGTH=382 /DNA_ID=CAMNT_0013322117 /DNA_START=39 /DNA_END=1187 /DNA_ORIENTATION=-